MSDVVVSEFNCIIIIISVWPKIYYARTAGGKKPNQAHYKYIKNIAMTHSLVILYPARRQSVNSVFFLHL